MLTCELDLLVAASICPLASHLTFLVLIRAEAIARDSAAAAKPAAAPISTAGASRQGPSGSASASATNTVCAVEALADDSRQAAGKHSDASRRGGHQADRPRGFSAGYGTGSPASHGGRNFYIPAHVSPLGQTGSSPGSERLPNHGGVAGGTQHESPSALPHGGARGGGGGGGGGGSAGVSPAGMHLHGLTRNISNSSRGSGSGSGSGGGSGNSGGGWGAGGGVGGKQHRSTSSAAGATGFSSSSEHVQLQQQQQHQRGGAVPPLSPATGPVQGSGGGGGGSGPGPSRRSRGEQ